MLSGILLRISLIYRLDNLKWPQAKCLLFVIPNAFLCTSKPCC